MPNLRQLEKKQKKIEASYNISGKYILLTGRIPLYTRTTIEKAIINLGGYVVSKVTIDVDILVFTRTNTSKYEKAKDYNRGSSKKILFVSGEEFVKNFLKL